MQDTLPFLGERVLPWGRRIQISAIWAPNRRSGECPGDEIVKKGAHCFRENPYCRQIAGFTGSAASKKGPNGPNWRGDNSPHGLLDVETGKRRTGDPTRHTPEFAGSGEEWEENTNDRRGRNPA